MITNINNNKVNSVHINGLKFDYNYNLSSELVSNPHTP